ncbi:hypothetical protein TWF506_006845 [Arthrobotrys conoides]|uniref:XPG-I domain-containing protein n=1 Tax=Arthrobotrys conoides TaxID=74498 RepID=A0AAN8NMP7_9PEZI
MSPNQHPKSWSTRDPKPELDLWTLFDQKSNQGTPTPLSQLSTIHFQTHRRPLRIALDQDSWNYGLTRPQERLLQKSQRKAFTQNQILNSNSQTWYTQKYTPLPKKPRLFHREINVLTRLMGYIALGVEFYVILPSPLEREDVGEMGDRYKHANGKIHIWFRILGGLGVRFHAARDPVVECVHMMEEGVVDAVWTNDPDVLVYCGDRGVVIRDCEGSEGEVRVYRMEGLRRDVGWMETVFIHTLVRGGCSIGVIEGLLNTNGSVQDTLTQRAINLCKCSSQEEIDDWFQHEIISHINNFDISNKPRYGILEGYLFCSVSNNNLLSKEAKLFRDRIHVRMQEIKETEADAIAFYNSNVTDKVRRLWEYSRDTFSIKSIQFLNLMAGVLLARRLGDEIVDSSLNGSIKEGITGIDSWTVKVPVNIEEEPILWNLRTKITKDLTGCVLNPVLLKILLKEFEVESNAENTQSVAKEDISHQNINMKRRKTSRRRKNRIR